MSQSRRMSDPLKSGGSNQLEFQEVPSLSLALPFPFYISGFTGSAGFTLP